MVNPHEPLARAVTGVCEQLTYIHARNDVFAPPGAYSPIQSLALGDAMPLQAAMTFPPAATLVGLTEKAGPPDGVTTPIKFCATWLPVMLLKARELGVKVYPLNDGVTVPDQPAGTVQEY